MLPALAVRSTPVWRALAPPETLTMVMLPALALTLMSLPSASVPVVIEVRRMLPAAVTLVEPLLTEVVRPPFIVPGLCR